MAGKVINVAHKGVDEAPSPSPSASRPMLNKEVKLDELSKYFHLPEKAVAKELGICLTSLKKLCRSYGITRWPFRKLKSLERTMKKVQTESDAANGAEENPADPTGRAAAGEVKRKPYTVGNKTVFLSDEELEVFKMTMGKEACSELKPTPIATLEPALFNTATMAAASSALASAARGVPASSSGADGDDPTSITAEVKGSNLVIVHWSTLWSQPQLKQKLLEPLNGAALRVSSDGVTAELDFRTEETAQRALRICRMAEMQAMQTAAPGNSMLYAGQSILQGGCAAGASGATVEATPASPPLSGSVHALLSDGCATAGLMQPPSTHAQHSFWSSFLSSTQHTSSGKENTGEGGGGVGRTSSSPGKEGHTGKAGGDKGEDAKGGGSGRGGGSGGPRSIGALGDSLPSPPMSSTTMGMLLDGAGGPLSMGAPMTNFFSSLFQSGLDGEGGGHNHSNNNGTTSQPDSSNSLSAYLDEGRKEKKKDKEAKDKE